MLGNGIVSTPSAYHKAALAAMIVLTLMLSGVAAVYAYTSDTHNGTVGGVSWSAFDSVDFDTGNGGWEYWGVSRTSAAAPMSLKVRSTGREWCSSFVIDTDWSASSVTTNGYSVEVSPPHGWVMIGQCSMFWWDPLARVSNQGYHQAVNQSQSDDVTQEPWEQLPTY